MPCLHMGERHRLVRGDFLRYLTSPDHRGVDTPLEKSNKAGGDAGKVPGRPVCVVRQTTYALCQFFRSLAPCGRGLPPPRGAALPPPCQGGGQLVLRSEVASLLRRVVGEGRDIRRSNALPLTLPQDPESFGTRGGPLPERERDKVAGPQGPGDTTGTRP